VSAGPRVDDARGAEVGREPPERLAEFGNIAGFFMHWAKRAPGRAAIHGPDGETVTFAELDARASRVATGLMANGFEVGSRALVMVPMSITLYAILLGVSKAGGCSVFVDPWARRPRLRQAVSLAAPSWFLGVTKAHLLRLFVPEVRHVPNSIIVDGMGVFGRRLNALEADGADEISPVEVDPSAPALLTFTTGSTGDPKGAARSHALLNAIGAALGRVHPPRPGDVDMPSMPSFVLQNLASGVPTVLPRGDLTRVSEVDAKGVLEQVRSHGITTLGGAPAFLAPIARAALADPGAVASVRWIGTGGARVPVSLLRELRAAFPEAELEVIYGATECEPIAVGDGDELIELDDPKRGVCVGRPVEGLDVRAGASPGEIGEVYLAGEHVQPEYYGDPLATLRAKHYEDGVEWHRTGDLGHFDDEGRLWLVGRASHVVETDRGPAYPHIIEACVERIPDVERAGLADRGGQSVVAVQARAGADRRALKDDVLARCEEEELPVDDVVLIDEMPVDRRHRTRIDRVALATRVERRRDR
jgi:acyl-CoA synthetase (AMP-forming)/AMP-acid ligase II